MLTWNMSENMLVCALSHGINICEMLTYVKKNRIFIQEGISVTYFGDGLLIAKEKQRFKELYGPAKMWD